MTYNRRSEYILCWPCGRVIPRSVPQSDPDWNLVGTSRGSGGGHRGLGSPSPDRVAASTLGRPASIAGRRQIRQVRKPEERYEIDEHPCASAIVPGRCRPNRCASERRVRVPGRDARLLRFCWRVQRTSATAPSAACGHSHWRYPHYRPWRERAGLARFSDS